MLTSITCVLVLLRVCFPLNLFKLVLCVLMMVGVGLCIFHPSLQSYFGFSKLTYTEIFLIIILAEASYPMIWIFSLSFTSIVKKFIKEEWKWKVNLTIEKINTTKDEIITNK